SCAAASSASAGTRTCSSPSCSRSARSRAASPTSPMSAPRCPTRIISVTASSPSPRPPKRQDPLVEPGLVFDRVAAEYDRVRPGYLPELVDAALAGAAIRRVLEVGCGTGQLTEALAARGLDVEAVEPGANLAELARRRVPSLEVHAGRFEDVELPESAYDALFSATAFHWVKPEIGWRKAA